MKTEVVISGYYGFDNLGDEAILEALVGKLSKFIPRENIVVLSNDPATTASRYEVKAVDRWKLAEIYQILKKARLFISGGGGLFQDSSSINSVIYYGALIALAKVTGTKVCVLAQGIGPLKSPISQMVTKSSMSMAGLISVRDDSSLSQLKEWNIPSFKTADLVWCLNKTPLAPTIEKNWSQIIKEHKGHKLVGLSLRNLAGFDDADLKALVLAMKQALPAPSLVVLLALQEEQDLELLQEFGKLWQAQGGKSVIAPVKASDKASQWLSLIGDLDLVIGMRLHALILALKCLVPVLALAYDPKVAHLLKEFEEPYIDLALARDYPAWTENISRLIKDKKKQQAKIRQPLAVLEDLDDGNTILLGEFFKEAGDKAPLPVSQKQ
jgi:polysaccharide pyruvyl transferase CsaB